MKAILQPSLRAARRFSARMFIFGLLLILSVFNNSFSQQKTARLSGTVTDELGGLVPNATIKLHSADGKELTTKTGAKGTYIFDDLKPGLYTLRVLAVGFSSFEERGVEVKLDLKNNYDVG